VKTVDYEVEIKRNRETKWERWSVWKSLSRAKDDARNVRYYNPSNKTRIKRITKIEEFVHPTRAAAAEMEKMK